MISVIIPTLNVSEYIDDCIGSIINQSIKDIEIICVDAQSTDGTCEKIIQYSRRDSRIKYICSPRKSYGYQVNLGIKEAKGEYIGIVDGDDFVDDNFFSILYSFTINTNPDYVKSGFMYYANNSLTNFTYEEKIIARKKNKLINLTEEDEYRYTDLSHIWSAIYRKSFLIQNNLWLNETDGASFQDTSFSFLVASMASSCVYVDECLYYYRIDRSESSVKSDTKWKCVCKEFSYIEKYLKQVDLKPALFRAALDEYRIVVYYWNLSRLHINTWELFWESIQGEIIRIISDSSIIERLPSDINEKLNTLRDKNASRLAVERNEYNAVKKAQLLNLLDDIQIPCVCICAGGLFDKMISFQNVLGRRIVNAVCDNNSDLWGHKRGEYIIESVEECVNSYRDKNWLIMSQRHSKDIEGQLISCGVERDNIYVIEYVPAWYEIYMI